MLGASDCQGGQAASSDQDLQYKVTLMRCGTINDTQSSTNLLHGLDVRVSEQEVDKVWQCLLHDVLC